MSTNAGADVTVEVEPAPAEPAGEPDRWAEVMGALGQLAQRVGALEGAAVSRVEEVVVAAEGAAVEASQAAEVAQAAAVDAQVAAIDAEVAVLDAEDAADEAEDAADETDENPTGAGAPDGPGGGEPVPVPEAAPAPTQDEAPRKAHWIHRRVGGRR